MEMEISKVPSIAIALVDVLEQAASRVATYVGNVFGNQSASFAGIPSSVVLVALFVFLLSTIAAWALRGFVRRRASRFKETTPKEGAENSTLLRYLLFQAAPPLAAGLWLIGTYLSVMLLLTNAVGGIGPTLIPVAEMAIRLGSILVILWLGLRVLNVLEWKLRSWAKASARRWDDILVAVSLRALRLVVPLLTIIFSIPILPLPDQFRLVFSQGVSLLITAAVGFIFYQLVVVAEQSVIEQYRVDQPHNLATRKVQTRVRMLKRIAVVMICVFTGASMLMAFDSVRRFGTSILASAGIAGIVAGFAAQRSLSALFAGVQIAFTQPIRWDDVVVLENEWGRIEEINLTYVVVRLWDQRRLVVPINYFIEKPFQNWTRTSAELVGAVLFHVDYSAPIPEMREELGRILKNSQFWDGKTQVLQVTEARERTLEVRVLVSARNSGAAFDLRCEVREKMIGFLQKHHPESLPRVRVDSPVIEGALASPAAVSSA